MVNIRRILAVVIVVSIIVLTGVVYRHLQQDPQEALKTLAENVDLALDDFHYTQNEDGKRVWTLDADRAEYLGGTSLATLDVVRLIFYEQGDLGDVHLTADRGELHEDTQQVDLYGHVVVTTDRGDRLITDSLHFDDRRRRLTTADPITITSKEVRLTGVGLQVDIDQGRMVVKENVHTLFYPAAEKDQ